MLTESKKEINRKKVDKQKTIAHVDRRFIWTDKHENRQMKRVQC